MSKNNKANGVYFVGNNAEDVTGSCILIHYNDKQILLECGLVQNNDYLESYRANSKKFEFKPSEIDYVFVNHVHADHCGLIPRLIKEGFCGKIIASHETAILMKPMLLNSAWIMASESKVLSAKFKRNYSPIYDEDDVYKTMNYVYEYPDIHREYFLDDIISFSWLENSHCVGARQLELNIKDAAGVKQSILYTSDIGALNTKNHYVPDTEIPKDYHKITIMESTYGTPGRTNKKKREYDIEHLRVAIDTVFSRGGSIIMPCFSFSRTQELLTVLYELYANDEKFTNDVVVDSMLSCEICDIYDQIIDKDDVWHKVKQWKNVHFISDKNESLACVKDHTPKIILSASGFCTNGRVLSYLHEYLSDENSMIIFSGYIGADNSYLSYRIKNYKENKVIKISGDPVKNNADCISLGSFSSHANRNDLIKYGSKIRTEKLVLVHGEPEAKGSLKEDLKKAISKENKTHRVLISSKGMFIKL